jgi:hypothetical protein
VLVACCDVLCHAVVCCVCRLPEKDGGALLVSALQGFAKYFFQCEVCRCVPFSFTKQVLIKLYVLWTMLAFWCLQHA